MRIQDPISSFLLPNTGQINDLTKCITNFIQKSLKDLLISSYFSVEYLNHKRQRFFNKIISITNIPPQLSHLIYFIQSLAKKNLLRYPYETLEFISYYSLEKISQWVDVNLGKHLIASKEQTQQGLKENSIINWDSAIQLEPVANDDYPSSMFMAEDQQQKKDQLSFRLSLITVCLRDLLLSYMNSILKQYQKGAQGCFHLIIPRLKEELEHLKSQETLTIEKVSLLLQLLKDNFTKNKPENLLIKNFYAKTKNKNGEIVYYEGRWLPYEVMVLFFEFKLNLKLLAISSIQEGLQEWKVLLNYIKRFKKAEKKTDFLQIKLSYIQTKFYIIFLKEFYDDFKRSLGSFDQLEQLLIITSSRIQDIQAGLKRENTLSCDSSSNKEKIIFFLEQFLSIQIDLCHKNKSVPLHFLLRNLSVFLCISLKNSIHLGLSSSVRKAHPSTYNLIKIAKDQLIEFANKSLEPPSLSQSLRELAGLMPALSAELASYSLIMENDHLKWETTIHCLFEINLLCYQIFQKIESLPKPKNGKSSDLFKPIELFLQAIRNEIILHYIQLNRFLIEKTGELPFLNLTSLQKIEFYKRLIQQMSEIRQVVKKTLTKLEEKKSHSNDEKDLCLKLPLLFEKCMNQEYLFLKELEKLQINPSTQLINHDWRDTPWGKIIVSTGIMEKFKAIFSYSMDATIDKLLTEVAKAGSDKEEKLSLVKRELYQFILLRIVDVIGEKQQDFKTIYKSSKQPLEEIILHYEVRILNRFFKKFIREYDQIPALTQSFQDYFLKQATTAADHALTGGYLTAEYMSYQEFNERLHYANLGYNMVDNIKQWSDSIGKLSEQNWMDRIRKEINAFLKWADKHPRVASNMMTDIVLTAQILKDKNFFKQLKSTIKVRAYMNAFLSKLDICQVEETPDIENELKYRALADLCRYGPRMASFFKGAAKGIRDCVEGKASSTYIFFSAFSELSKANTVQHMTKHVSHNAEAVKTILEILRGKSLSYIIESRSVLEMIRLTSLVRQAFFHPQNFINNLKIYRRIWWHTLGESTGYERKIRIIIQLITPCTTACLSAGMLIIGVLNGGVWGFIPLVFKILSISTAGLTLAMGGYTWINYTTSIYPKAKQKALEDYFKADLEQQINLFLEHLKNWHGLPKPLVKLPEINFEEISKQVNMHLFQMKEKVFKEFHDKLEYYRTTHVEELKSPKDYIFVFNQHITIHAIQQRIEEIGLLRLIQENRLNQKDFYKLSYRISYDILGELEHRWLKEHLKKALFQQVWLLTKETNQSDYKNIKRVYFAKMKQDLGNIVKNESQVPDFLQEQFKKKHGSKWSHKEFDTVYHGLCQVDVIHKRTQKSDF